MKLDTSTVLITGGATGIGFGLAERFVAQGARVIICGRREDALRRAQEQVPALHTMTADVAHEADRCGLAERVLRDFPTLNVLVNNAGIQRQKRFSVDDAPWSERQAEIAINFIAPLHLVSLFASHLGKQPNAAIVNVTSGLAFIPAAIAPVYCATKAALHSFSVSLRYELASRHIEVIELIPPAVDTDLGGPGLHANCTPLHEFADAAMSGFLSGQTEIAYGVSEKARRASRAELDEMAARFNGA